MPARFPSSEERAELGFDPTAWQHISDAIWVYDLGRDLMV